MLSNSPSDPSHSSELLKPIFSSSLLSRAMVCWLLGSCLLVNLFPSLLPWLSLTPGLLLWGGFRLWTLLTSAVVETSPLFAAAGAWSVFQANAIIEPLWGARELLRLLLLTALLSSCAVYLLSLFLFMWSLDEALFYPLPFGYFGAGSLFVALLVALKALFPETLLVPRLALLPASCAFSLRLKHAAPLYVLSSALCAALGLYAASSLLYTVCGAFWAWLYLRFYQRHDGLVGDILNPNLSFVSFFPPLLHPLVSPPAALVYDFMLRLGFFTDAFASCNTSPHVHPLIHMPSSHALRVDSDWRDKAALELEERIKEMEQSN